MSDVVFLNSSKSANGLGFPRIWELFFPARLYDRRLLSVAIYGNHLTPTNPARAYAVYVFGRKMIWQRLRCPSKIDYVATWLRNSDVRQISFQSRPSSHAVLPRSPSIISNLGKGARVDVVGWGTERQAERSRVRFPMVSLEWFYWHNPSGRIMALWSTQHVTEMSTRNISWRVKAAGA